MNHDELNSSCKINNFTLEKKNVNDQSIRHDTESIIEIKDDKSQLASPSSNNESIELDDLQVKRHLNDQLNEVRREYHKNFKKMKDN